MPYQLVRKFFQSETEAMPRNQAGRHPSSQEDLGKPNRFSLLQIQFCFVPEKSFPSMLPFLHTHQCCQASPTLRTCGQTLFIVTLSSQVGDNGHFTRMIIQNKNLGFWFK